MKILFLILSFFISVNSFVEALEEKRLHEFLVEFDARTERDWERLPYAIEKGYTDVASFFVTRGERVTVYSELTPVELDKINPNNDVNQQDIYIKHPLLTAIRKGYNGLALEMLQMGVKPSTSVEQRNVLRKVSGSLRYNERILIGKKTALYVYLSEGKTDLSLLMGLLLKSDPQDLNVLIYGGGGEGERYSLMSSPLSVAIEFGRLQDARTLLEKGALTDKTDSAYMKGLVYGSPLFFAVKKHDKEAVMLLSEFGADPLHQTKNPNNSSIQPSPLNLALQLGYDDLVDILLAAACK